MKITWEDRKNRGHIDNYAITEKPVFSFEYAWFLVTEDTAQYVESHEYGNWNKDMTEAQREEVNNFYTSYKREPNILPEFNSSSQKLVENGTEVIDGLTYKKYAVVDLTQEELDAKFKVIVPSYITLRQAREQIIRVGLFANIETYIESIQDATEKAIARNYWEYSEVFQREHPLLIAMASGLGMSDVDLDNLFIEASKL